MLKVCMDEVPEHCCLCMQRSSTTNPTANFCLSLISFRHRLHAHADRIPLMTPSPPSFLPPHLSQASLGVEVVVEDTGCAGVCQDVGVALLQVVAGEGPVVEGRACIMIIYELCMQNNTRAGAAAVTGRAAGGVQDTHGHVSSRDKVL